MLTSSTHLQNRSFHVVERTRTSSKRQKMKNARAKRAKILFFIVKYANLWCLCCRCRRGCLSSLVSSSNHLTIATRASQICIFNNEKLYFCKLHVNFPFMHNFIVLSTSWNDLFFRSEDHVSTWQRIFRFVFLYLKRWLQFNSTILRTHLARIMTWNTWEVIAEVRSCIFRWCSPRCRRRRLHLSSYYWKIDLTFKKR